MKLNLFPPCVIIYKLELGSRDNKTIYGLSKGFMVWIRKDVAEDRGVLEHELEHVRQAWRGLILFHMILLLIPSYRTWCEKKAVEKQNSF
jgi:hypothetical protein